MCSAHSRAAVQAPAASSGIALAAARYTRRVNFDALADEVNYVSRELGFRLEQPARFVVAIEHREFDR